MNRAFSFQMENSLFKENVLYIGSLNVANAMRDENSKDRFGTRINDLLLFLKSKRDTKNFDILLLQEIRRCKHADGVTILEPIDIIRLVEESSGLTCAIAQPNNTDDVAFWKATFINLEKLYHNNTRTIWLGENPDRTSGSDFEFGKNIMISNFTILGTDIDFQVGNVHAPFNKDIRGLYFETMIKHVINQDLYTIMIGDYNTIPDMRGLEHIQLLETVFDRPSKDLGITFIGFDHDCDPLTRIPYQSQLDQVCVFNSKDVSVIPRVDVSATNVIFNGTRLSDHFLIETTVHF